MRSNICTTYPVKHTSTGVFKKWNDITPKHHRLYFKSQYLSPAFKNQKVRVEVTFVLSATCFQVFLDD